MSSFGNILIVDSNVSEADAVIAALRDSGFQGRAVTCNDIAGAKQYLNSIAPTLSETDDVGDVPTFAIFGPGLSFEETNDVLHEMRQSVIHRRTPTVSFVPRDADGRIDEGYDLGMNSYLHQPEGPEEFRAMISQLYTYWFTINKLPPD